VEITGAHLIKWGRKIETVRVRPVFDFEPTSPDGVDRVAVDRALRGQPVPLTPDELDEVCRVLDLLRREYHDPDSTVPIGRYDDRRSPYLIIKDLLVEEYGPQFDVLYDRYRDKVRARERRERARLNKDD